MIRAIFLEDIVTHQIGERLPVLEQVDKVVPAFCREACEIEIDLCPRSLVGHMLLLLEWLRNAVQPLGSRTHSGVTVANDLPGASGVVFVPAPSRVDQHVAIGMAAERSATTRGSRTHCPRGWKEIVPSVPAVSESITIPPLHGSPATPSRVDQHGAVAMAAGRSVTTRRKGRACCGAGGPVVRRDGDGEGAWLAWHAPDPGGSAPCY